MACRLTADILELNPEDIPFALLYLVDDEATHARLIATSGFAGEGRAGFDRIDLTASVDSTGWPLRRVLDTGSAEVVSDLGNRVGQLPAGSWPEAPESAFVVPMSSAGQSRGVLVAGFSPRRIVDADYRSFFELIAGHVSTAVANARAYGEERKRAEALAEIDRAKTAFFSNVSHEFRTPLTLMLGPLQDLLGQSDGQLSSTAREQLEVVKSNGARLLRLVNTLLDFSRIEAGRAQAVYEPTDLPAITAELASTFRSASERAGLELVVDCREIGEPVYVDRDLWEKIVLNLLSNALKFTFEGKIAVSIERVGPVAELRVRDTGVGIPAEEMPRLFERFHRIPNIRSRTLEGSGIGLALVQELVKLHGGSISVESAVGKGTTFTVRIPLGQEHLPAAQLGGSGNLAPTGVGAARFVEEALRWLPDSEHRGEAVLPAGVELRSTAAAPRSPDRCESRARVLVADDNSDMRQYLMRLLQRDYEVEAVANGQEAIESARKRMPDLVLSDVMMPVVDGFELLSALRADQRTRTVPVILLSARAGEESRVEGMEAGADDYLVKPFSARELLSRVGARVEIARLQRESEQRYRDLAETLEAQVRNRTRDLEERNAEILAQTEQVYELSARLLHSQDEERKRIARELHDSAGQTLAVLGLEQARIAHRLGDRPDLVRQMKDVQALTDQLTQEIRTASYLLHPPLLDDSGLAGALRWYVDGLMSRSGIEVELEISQDFGRLPAIAEMAIFRIVQEALTNIHRHSKSKDAVIKITRDHQKAVLEIEDHGTGMSAEKLATIQTHGGGVGIRGMRERLRQLHGEMTMESSPAGTKISIRIPVENAHSSSESVRAIQASGAN